MPYLVRLQDVTDRLGTTVDFSTWDNPMPELTPQRLALYFVGAMLAGVLLKSGEGLVVTAELSLQAARSPLVPVWLQPLMWQVPAHHLHCLRERYPGRFFRLLQLALRGEFDTQVGEVDGAEGAGAGRIEGG